MYEISVPIHINNVHFEKRRVLDMLKLMKADRIFLIVNRDAFLEKNTIPDIFLLKELIPYFKKGGLDVGVWVGSTIGHGCDEINTHYKNIVNIDGSTPANVFCPLDESFSSDISNWIADIAKVGAKLILLDDDFRLSFRGAVACCCDLHMKEYENRIGEKIEHEELMGKLFCSTENKYRTTWLELMGDTLKGFAGEIRSAVDKIDKTVRVGLCASPSTWDIDGVDSIELSKIFAGETKPFLRLIGAPYWTALNISWAPHLEDVIEIERLQAHWCKAEGIEIIAEGDTYPRPRYSTPSAYLEGFDTAIRASGELNGILKYVTDYCSSYDYEREYVKKSIGNIGLYKDIGKYFGNKISVGVNVFENIHNLKKAQLPEKNNDANYINNMFFPTSIRFLSNNSIPISYNTDGACVVFGENAKYIDNDILKRGVILDITAAKYLMDRGIDVGICSADETKSLNTEYYIEENEHVIIGGNTKLYDVKVNPLAKILTRFIGKNSVNGAFEYENQNNEKFLIYPFDAYESRDACGIIRSYSRQRQLVKSIEWLSGKLEAVCVGHPDLYILCKKGENSLTVGLWNFFADTVDSPVVTLRDKYSTIEFLNCSGRLENDKVHLTDINPYGFAGFEIII